MKLTQLLFDLDNTLYSASSGLFPEIARRMTEFVAQYFGIEPEVAVKIRKDYAARFGTTLSGLMEENEFTEPERFMTAVHPENIADYIQKDPALFDMLYTLPYKKSIFTNSPRDHALRVLEHLGIQNCFDSVFDIRFCAYQGKPVPGAYHQVLAALEKSPEETLLIDDVPHYLHPFATMGGNVLLVDEEGKNAEELFPTIKRIVDLPDYLKNFVS